MGKTMGSSMFPRKNMGKIMLSCRCSLNNSRENQVSLVQSAIGDGVDRSSADFAELLQALRNRSKEGLWDLVGLRMQL